MKRQSLVRNQKGFMALLTAIGLMVFISLAIVMASRQTDSALRKHSATQYATYADDLSIKLAQKIRWGFDVAQAAAANPSMSTIICPALEGASIVPINPTVSLCMINSKICVHHPRGGKDVCISHLDGTLLAFLERGSKYDAIAAMIGIKKAYAQVGRPLPPLNTDTDNDLLGLPSCGLEKCGAQCNTDTCVTFHFCPIQSCTPDEMVWQTIALLR